MPNGQALLFQGELSIEKHGVYMLNRRYLRIKVLQILYGHYRGNGLDAAGCERQIEEVLSRFPVLLHYLALLPVLLVKEAEKRIERGLHKYRPTEEERNPNRSFVENGVITLLAEDVPLREFAQKKGVNWTIQNSDFIAFLFDRLTKEPFYQEYMQERPSVVEETKLETLDKNLVLDLIRWAVSDEAVQEYLAECDMHWSTDWEMGTITLLSQLRHITRQDEHQAELIPRTVPHHHKEYTQALLQRMLSTHKQNIEYIGEAVHHWSPTRLAAMDLLILELGIVETLYFHDIPWKATLNECIELARDLSTPQSSGFVNGILDKVGRTLKEKGLVLKEIPAATKSRR